MISMVGRTAKADRSLFAVLCGVEALSAQQWAVGAISFCVNVFFAQSGPNGTASSEKNLRKPFKVSRELKGEG
jgi:hypothetical protein